MHGFVPELLSRRDILPDARQEVDVCGDVRKTDPDFAGGEEESQGETQSRTVSVLC